MNDIKPSKSAKQSAHEAPAPATDRVTTNVHPRAKTNVGKPIRRWPKRVGIALVVVGMAVISYMAFRQLDSRSSEPVKAVPGARKITDPQELKRLKEAPGQPLVGTE